MSKNTISIELTDEQVKSIKRYFVQKRTSKTVVTRCRILLDLDNKHGKRAFLPASSEQEWCYH